jgi:hypothetical protein
MKNEIRRFMAEPADFVNGPRKRLSPCNESR